MKTAVPTIGPSILPSPPMITMKIIQAVQLHAEGGRGLDAQQAHVHDRSGDGGADGRDEVDGDLGPEHVHAQAAGSDVAVADRAQ